MKDNNGRKNPTIKETALRKLRVLKNDRTTWEPVWKDIADFCLPYAGRWTGDKLNDGKKKGERIMDSFQLRCVKNLAAFLFTGLTSPSQPWFRLGMADSSLEDIQQVKVWLEATQTRMYEALQRSNFYLTIHQLYEELGAFGSTCMYMEEDSQTFLRCAHFTIGRFYLAADPKGRIDTILRVVPMTARQVSIEFGEDNLPQHMKAAFESDEVITFDILHAVFPNPDFDPYREDSRSMPFVSIYIDLTDESIEPLRQGYYAENPFFTPRWTVTGENTYGQSPGFDALSEIRQLQVERRDRLDAVNKIIDPPLVVPSGYTERVKTSPGAINTETVGGDQKGIRPLYEVDWNIATVITEMQDARQAISSMFFNDLILMIDESKDMTATEVLERKQEKMLMLGPIIERLQSELLGPVIDRAFGILYRAGQLPDPSALPPAAQGAAIKVDYISPLAQAQRKVSISAITSTLAFAMQAASADPSALDRLDISEAVQTFADLSGVPANLIRSDDIVAMIRQQRQQQQAEAAKAQAIKEGLPIVADAAQKASNVDMGKNTLGAAIAKDAMGEDKTGTTTQQTSGEGSVGQ